MLLICTGLVAGGIAYLIQDDQNIADIYFTPTIFFVIILPPIVFEAGYFMPKDPFFDNLGTILTYAIFGTFFNAMAIGGSIYCVVTYGLVPGFDEEIRKGEETHLYFSKKSSAFFTRCKFYSLPSVWIHYFRCGSGRCHCGLR